MVLSWAPFADFWAVLHFSRCPWLFLHAADFSICLSPFSLFAEIDVSHWDGHIVSSISKQFRAPGRILSDSIWSSFTCVIVVGDIAFFGFWWFPSGFPDPFSVGATKSSSADWFFAFAVCLLIFQLLRHVWCAVWFPSIKLVFNGGLPTRHISNYRSSSPTENLFLRIGLGVYIYNWIFSAECAVKLFHGPYLFYITRWVRALVRK